MANIKSMFSNMMNGNGSTDAPEAAAAPKAAKGKVAIEKTYQKKTQLEHILLRPDTYIGSVEHVQEQMWVYDTEKSCMVSKQISYCPGLYKIFDEILVNAADNKQRDKNMDCIKIDINAESNTISIWNNGQGIPVAMHKDENMFVPTMIFGHLLTSSNYDDDEEKVVGGRNGYGAKLCNIFSTKFTVETASKEYKKHFKQTWGNNMAKASEPKIKPHTGDDYTKITFSPDLAKFHMEKLDDDIVALMTRRAYDIAASTRGVKVMLNGERVKVKNFKDYIELYTKSREDDPTGPPKVIYESVNDRWEVAVTTSDRNFQQVSFVNSIATTKGGRHVDYVADMIVKQLIEIVKKKNKGGVNIKPFQVKNHMWIFVNCLIVNPSFDSQTKENMTTQSKKFGSKCDLNDKFINAVAKSGIVETVLNWAKFKAQTELNKQSGKKQCKLKGIPKLEDANDAGTKNAHKCTLILTEGDSAKCLAVSGLGVVGRDHYGVFPLRGKLLNVREATHKQILDNAEINTLIKILGLQYKMKYLGPEQMKSLRYGKVMIMTDQDPDGSHIKGLIINFIHHFWPELLRQNFLEVFITPIVKVFKKNIEFSFYSLPEFDEWKQETADYQTYSVKYYKGLGTSTSKEAKEYFKNMERHRITLKYSGQDDDRNILLAFSKKEVDNRKDWLHRHNEDLKQRKELGLPEVYLYTKETRTVTYSEYVQKELVYFSNGDNVRSIPSLVDGLKPGQRKVLFTCIKRNDKKEVKVAQLAGSVAEMSAYHHGEQSLCMTIVNLAQNYVGSNNINLLEPRGQFGTRLNGGKDSASPRYIFTKMSPLTRLLFHPHDDPLLRYETDDNQKIEPFWYIPIIPMCLVNGAEGIGTGWATKIPNFNPREIIENIRLLIEGQDPKPMSPWYKNFKGSIEYCGYQRYICSGEISITDNDEIEITELPVGTWTQVYKENVLENLLHGSEKVKAVIQDYKEYSTDTTVKFVVTPLPGQLRNMEQSGLHNIFKLQSSIGTSSMVLFDELGGIKKYDNVEQILLEYYQVRMRMYVKRKDYLENTLEAEANKLTYQAKFILEKCSGKITVENKQRKTMVDELIKRGYPADPVKELKEKQAREMNAELEEDKDEQEDQEEEEEQIVDTKKKGKEKDPDKAFNNLSDVKKYDYLLGMSMWMLTTERKNQLLKQRDDKMAELKILKEKTPADLWREDLDAFSAKLYQVEEKERLDEAQSNKKDVVKTKGGRKQKLNVSLETMPSPAARRIEPRVQEFKDKVMKEMKAKERRGNKKNLNSLLNASDEKDEFDLMTDNKKSLKDKLGNSPDKIEEGLKKKRAAKAKEPKEKKSKKTDGLVQTKLNFKKGSPKGKKKLTIDTDESAGEKSDLSDMEFESIAASAPSRERTSRRAVVNRQVNYKIDIESDKSDGSDMELFDNDLIKEELPKTITLSDDSDDEVPKIDNELKLPSSDDEPQQSKPKVAKKSKPKATASTTTKKKSKYVQSDDDDFNFESDEEIVKPKSRKKTIESDDDFEKYKPKSRRKKINSDDDDDDDDFEVFPSKSSKKKIDSDDDDFPAPTKKPSNELNKSTDELFDSLFENSANDNNSSANNDLDDSDMPIGQKMAAEKRKADLDCDTKAKKIKGDKKR